MEGSAASVLEDHWQHSMPLFCSSTPQRIEPEEKKIKRKNPSSLEVQDETNGIDLIPAGISYTETLISPPPSQKEPGVRASRTEKYNSVCPDVFLTSKDVILVFGHFWEEQLVQPSEDRSTQEPMKKGLSCLEGQVGTSGSQRKLWWGPIIFPVPHTWPLVLTFLLCCYLCFSSNNEDQSCSSFHHVFHKKMFDFSIRLCSKKMTIYKHENLWRYFLRLRKKKAISICSHLFF